MHRPYSDYGFSIQLIAEVLYLDAYGCTISSRALYVLSKKYLYFHHLAGCRLITLRRQKSVRPSREAFGVNSIAKGGLSVRNKKVPSLQRPIVWAANTSVSVKFWQKHLASSPLSPTTLSLQDGARWHRPVSDLMLLHSSAPAEAAVIERRGRA